MSGGYAEIFVDTVIRETTNALLCEIGDRQVWIPRSQICFEESDIYEEGDGNGVVVIPEWLAIEKELI